MRVRSVNRFARSAPVALSAAAAMAAAVVPSSAHAATNTPVFVVGTDLGQASSYNTSAGTPNGALPGYTNDVVINSSTPTPASLILNTSLGIGTLNDLAPGATVINDNGAGGTNITLLNSTSGDNSTAGAAARDVIFVNGGAGSSLSLTSSTNHSNSITLGNNSSFDVLAGSTFTYNATFGGSLNLNGRNLTITGGGTVNINSGTSNTALITGGTGSIAVTGAGAVGAPGTAGAGEVSFNLGTAANNTYTGTTSISAGSVLAINAAGTTGTLTYGATGAITDNGTLVLAPATGRTLAFATPIAGTGSVRFQKSNTTGGAAFLNITSPAAGPNSYSGGTTIGNSTTSTTGTLSISDGGALGTGAITIIGQGTVGNQLQVSGGITLPNNVNLQCRNDPTAGSPGVAAIAAASGSNTLSGNLTVTNGGGTSVNLQNTTAGTLLTLSGNEIDNSNPTSTHVFTYFGAGDFLVSGAISGPATFSPGVKQETTGTVTLTGNNTYAGGTNITAGPMVAAAAVTGSTPLGTGNVTDGTTLQFNPGTGITQSIPGVVSGAGVVTHTGAGTTALSNNNSYAGGTTISAGTLQANGTTSTLGTGATAINGGTLAGTGATGGAVTFTAGTITGGSGATVDDGVGTLTVGTPATPAALTLSGSDAYAAKLDGSKLGTATSATVATANNGSVSALTGASDNLIVSTLGSGGTLVVNPVLTTAGAGSFAPGTTYYFVIGQSATSATAFDGLVTLGGGVTAGTPGAPNTYALDTAVVGSGEDLLLEYTTAAAPEPTSLLLAGIAAVPLALGRRRQMAAAV